MGDNCEGDCGNESTICEMTEMLPRLKTFCFAGFVEFMETRFRMGTAKVMIV